MTDEDVPRILEEVTQEILARMRRDGFTVTDDGPVRYDPIIWDINNGRCEEWAELASERLPGPSFTQWIDPYHCVLFYRGLWYDADRPDGVVDWENLPMIADPGMDRPEPLRGAEVKAIIRYSIPIDGKRHEFSLTHMPGKVSASMMKDELYFWVIQDDAFSRHDIEFMVVGTGDEIPSEAVWIGSQVDRGPFAHHLISFPPEGLYGVPSI